MKKSIGSVFFAFVLLTVLMSGCAPASTPVPPTPTLMPIPTSTSTPLSAPVGHWEGEPSVSFDVTADGNIANFRFEYEFDTNTSQANCVITSDKISIKPDKTFAFTFGEPENQGDNVIQGMFLTNNTVSGTLSKTFVCLDQAGGTLTFRSLKDITWSAEWKSP